MAMTNVLAPAGNQFLVGQSIDYNFNVSYWYSS